MGTTAATVPKAAPRSAPTPSADQEGGEDEGEPPWEEGPARISLATAAAGGKGGAWDSALDKTGPTQELGGQGHGPPRTRTRRGGKPTPPQGQKRRGAANRHFPKITIISPVSASLPHRYIGASTTGQKGCVTGDLGAWARGIARRGAHA